MIDIASVSSGLKPLTVVYSVFAVGYLVTRAVSVLWKRPRMESYILSDSKGNSIEVTWAATAPAEERAQVMNEKVHLLKAKTARARAGGATAQ